MKDMSLEEAVQYFLQEQEGVAVFDKFVFIDRKMFDDLMEKAKSKKYRKDGE